MGLSASDLGTTPNIVESVLPILIIDTTLLELILHNHTRVFVCLVVANEFVRFLSYSIFGSLRLRFFANIVVCMIEMVGRGHIMVIVRLRCETELIAI